MFRRVVISFVLVAAFTGCASKSDTSSSTTAAQAQTVGPFSVATQFAPDPPKQGPETITVTVKDAGGNPVKGASVKIVTKMPTMSMSGPTLTTTDNGDGTYAAQTNLNYATQWTFDISVSAGARSGVARVVEDVK
ncbi:MAG: FixH family protein [Candidatus Eremiobacteraeota bacterium]|nr:FixH family protein [Candidatus Eremiobacteraeota bacterium]